MIYSFTKEFLSLYRAESVRGAEVTMINEIDKATALMMCFGKNKQVSDQFKQNPTGSNMMGEAQRAVLMPRRET